MKHQIIMQTIQTTLPHLSDHLFISDGGLETTLVFHEKVDLPHFAACHLMTQPAGREMLQKYYHSYAELATRYHTGFILESPTWRANPDWAEKLGYSPAQLEWINRESIGFMHDIRELFEQPGSPFIVSACIGPRGDGYVVGATMSPDEAAAYHRPQLKTYHDAGADMVSAFTLTYRNEGLGIANAAAQLGIPAVLSFTLETDGRLPSGETLGEVIEAIDSSALQAPAYYMINCAHPTHFVEMLEAGASWLDRVVGVRANASCRSHAELDACEDLDIGNPEQLGEQYRELLAILPNLKVFGGCCGTDHRHLEAIGSHCLQTV